MNIHHSATTNGSPPPSKASTIRLRLPVLSKIFNLMETS